MKGSISKILKIFPYKFGFLTYGNRIPKHHTNDLTAAEINSFRGYVNLRLIKGLIMELSIIFNFQRQLFRLENLTMLFYWSYAERNSLTKVDCYFSLVTNFL